METQHHSSSPAPLETANGAPTTTQPTTADGGPPSQPRTSDGTPTSSKLMEDGGLEESLNELSKEYALSIGMEFESEDDATRIGQDVPMPMPMPYVPEMFNGESNLSSQTTYEVTGTESYLQDDEFFALFSNPDKSRVQ